MKNEGFLYVAAAVLCLAWLVSPGNTQAAKTRGLNLNIGGNAESCAELKVRSTGETAQVNESFTLSRGEAPTLELNAADRGQIRVRGWDRADYSVEACPEEWGRPRGHPAWKAALQRQAAGARTGQARLEAVFAAADLRRVFELQGVARHL